MAWTTLRERLRSPLFQNSVPTWLVCIGLLITQTGFGLYPIMVKLYGDHGSAQADPLIFSLYRDIACSPILFLCAFVAERKILKPSLKMLLVFALSGLMMYGGQYLYILAVYHVGPTPTAAFQPAIPIWTSLVAALTCTEKLPSYRKIAFWAKFAGILLAAGGAVEIILTSNNQQSNDGKGALHYVGYLFAISCTFVISFFILIQRRFIFGKPDNEWRNYPVSVTACSYIFATIFMGLTSLQYVTKPEKYQIPLQTLYALVYAIFVTSGLCYLLLVWATAHVSSIVVTAFWPLQVLVTIIVAWFLLGDKFAPLQYVGAGVLILGLFLVLWSEYQDDREKQGKGGIISRISLDCRQYDDEEQKPLLYNNEDYHSQGINK